MLKDLSKSFAGYGPEQIQMALDGELCEDEPLLAQGEVFQYGKHIHVIQFLKNFAHFHYGHLAQHRHHFDDAVNLQKFFRKFFHFFCFHGISI